MLWRVIAIRSVALLMHAIADAINADGGVSNAVDMYNSATGAWTTAQLSVARSSLAGTSVGNLAIFAGGYNSKVVDLYNSATGAWSTAQLSVARYSLAATSVGNLAIFAGGSTGALQCRNGA